MRSAHQRMGVGPPEVKYFPPLLPCASTAGLMASPKSSKGSFGCLNCLKVGARHLLCADTLYLPSGVQLLVTGY